MHLTALGAKAALSDCRNVPMEWGRGPPVTGAGGRAGASGELWEPRAGVRVQRSRGRERDPRVEAGVGTVGSWGRVPDLSSKG